jgi:hypothetical protein
MLFSGCLILFLVEKTVMLLWFRFRALKFFAVHCGLLIASASWLTRGKQHSSDS